MDTMFSLTDVDWELFISSKNSDSEWLGMIGEYTDIMNIKTMKTLIARP